MLGDSACINTTSTVRNKQAYLWVSTLGARPVSLVRTIVLRSIALAAVGVAAGLVLVAALAGTLASLLYDIAPTDLRTLALVAFVLIAIALAASLFPAWRATRIDPLAALRYE